jgi:Cyclin, N-terminal domain
MTEFKFQSMQNSNEKENSRGPLLDKQMFAPKSKPLQYAISIEYGDSIEKTQKLKETETSTEDCLKSHRINEELRSKMVDWMVEVLSVFNCSDRTLFLSVRLMDLFFKKENNTLGIEELHVIGVVCMMIASKYEDIKNLSMNTIYDKIGHQRLPKSYLINIEKRILQAIEYKVCIPTVLDFLDPLIENCSYQLKKTAKLIAELAQIESGLAWMRPSYLAQSIYLMLVPDSTAAISSHTLFIVHTIKNFLFNYSYPYTASFLKHNATINPGDSNWFTFSNEDLEV